MIISGAISIQTDLQHGIVKNRIILSSALIAFIINSIYYLCYAGDFFINWSINIVVTAYASVLLFLGRMWGAGDAKLFILMFCCVPGRLLDGFSLSYGIIPFLYVFSLSTIWLIIDTFKQHKKNHQQKTKTMFSLSDLWKTGIVMIETLTISILLSTLFPKFMEQNSLFCSFCIICYSYCISGYSWIKNIWVILIHVLVLVLCYTVSGVQYNASSLWFYLAILVVACFSRFSSRYNYEEIPTSSVEKGMIVSAETIIRFQSSKVHNLPNNASENMSARLTQIEAEAVRRWEHSANGCATITIVRKIPFAFMIPIGYIIWMAIVTMR